MLQAHETMMELCTHVQVRTHACAQELALVAANRIAVG
jgi:hypothetical protein